MTDCFASKRSLSLFMYRTTSRSSVEPLLNSSNSSVSAGTDVGRSKRSASAVDPNLINNYRQLLSFMTRSILLCQKLHAVVWLGKPHRQFNQHHKYIVTERVEWSTNKEHSSLQKDTSFITFFCRCIRSCGWGGNASSGNSDSYTALYDMYRTSSSSTVQVRIRRWNYLMI